MLGSSVPDNNAGMVAFCYDCGAELTAENHWYDICGFNAVFCTVCTLTRVVDASENNFKLEYDLIPYGRKHTYIR